MGTSALEHQDLCWVGKLYRERKEICIYFFLFFFKLEGRLKNFVTVSAKRWALKKLQPSSRPLCVSAGALWVSDSWEETRVGRIFRSILAFNETNCFWDNL